jgi:uncharacterized repeat protein (TIGR01451 family)
VEVSTSDFDVNKDDNSNSIETTVNPQADLSVTQTAPQSVRIGDNLTYRIEIRNNGLSKATGVTLTVAFSPSGVPLVDAAISGRPCPLTNGSIICAVPELANSATASATIILQPAVAGKITNTASVTGNEADSRQENNSSAVETTVMPPVYCAAIENEARVSSSTNDPVSNNNLARAIITISNATSLSPTSRSFPAAGGSGSLSISAQGGCEWTTNSNASWITITSFSKIGNNGAVDYSVAENTDSGSREGTLNIAGAIFTVTQAGAASAGSNMASRVFVKPHSVPVTSVSPASYSASELSPDLIIRRSGANPAAHK